MEEFKTKTCKDYKKDTLVVVCKNLNLKISGTKKDLYERIGKYYNGISKGNFDNLPIEIILNILSNLDIGDLNKIISKSRRLHYICKNNRSYLIKMILEKNKVDYTDPGNFIYFDERSNEFIPIPDDLEKVFGLYLKHYNKLSIEVNNKNITSIPLYPKLEELHCQGNQIIQIPIMPNIQVLNCEKNQITQIPKMPELKELWCSNNQLTQIPIMPELKKLCCTDNKITTLPIMPKLTFAWCCNNKITTLPIMPKLKTLLCEFNQITTLPIMPKLTFVRGIKSNQIK